MIMRYNFSPIRVGINKQTYKQTRNNKCWRECEEIGTLVYMVLMSDGVVTVDNSVVIPQKVKL